MLKWTFLNIFSKFGIWALGSLPSTTPGPFKGFRMAQLFSYINTFLLFHWAASPANAAKGTVGKTVVLRLNQIPAVAPNSTKATGFTTGTHSGKKPVLCRVVLNEWEFGYRHTYRRKVHEDRWRPSSIPQGCLRLLAPGRKICNSLSLTISEGANPANALTSDFWPPELSQQ